MSDYHTSNNITSEDNSITTVALRSRRNVVQDKRNNVNHLKSVDLVKLKIELNESSNNCVSMVDKQETQLKIPVEDEDDIKVNTCAADSECDKEEKTPGQPVQETAQPLSSNIQLKLWTRDLLQQRVAQLTREIEEDNCKKTYGHDAEMCVKLGGNDHLSKALCEGLNAQTGGILNEYCDDAQFKPGSIVITLKITTKTKLQRLLIDLENGTYLNTVKAMIQKELDRLKEEGEEVQEFGMLFGIDYSHTQLVALEKLFGAEPLPHPVDYTYCSHKSRWFWSPDRENWFSSLVPMVTKGDWEGYKPQEADSNLLEKLNLCRDLQNDSTIKGCLICEMSKDCVQEEFYDTSLKFTITERENVDDVNNNADNEVSIRTVSCQKTRRAVKLDKIDTLPKIERATIGICEQLEKLPVRLDEVPSISCAF